MAKAKLLSFTPVMRGGVHSTWTKDNKTYYNFNVEFDNGDKGQASSNSSTPKWKVGESYTYELSTNSSGYVSIRSMKSADFVPGGGSRNNPDENKNIAYNVSLDCAIKYAAFKNQKALPTDVGVDLEAIQKIAKYFMPLLVPHIEDKQKFISACSALKQSVAIAENNISISNTGAKITKLEEVVGVFNIVFNNLLTNGNPSMG